MPNKIEPYVADRAFSLVEYLCVLRRQRVHKTEGGAWAHCSHMHAPLPLPIFPFPPFLSESLHHVGYKELREAKDQSVSL